MVFGKPGWVQGYLTYLMVSIWQHLMVDARLRELVLITKSLGAVEVVKDIHDTPAVPVVSDSPSIVDVACCVFQHL